MKKIFTTVLLSTAFLLSKGQIGTTVVISQVYGGGGNSGATYTNDFIELFNPTQSAVSLNGWSVQYASSAGSTWTATPLTNFSLQPGQYYLIQEANGAGAGVALPTADAIGSIAMSSTMGKIALVNNTTALTGACPAGVIDFVGYGSANCFEGAATPALSSTTSASRNSNGCTDGNNNATDFTVGIPSARNSASPVNICGPATPVISASPTTVNVTTTTGTASMPVTFNIQASTLSPAAGNLTVAPGTDVEISLNSGGPFISSSLNIPYSSGGLSAKPVYVRLAATAAQGIFDGSLTISGGTAPDATVAVKGGVFQNYYNTKANLGLHDLNSWSSTINGSGAAPASFSNDYQLFNIINAANTDYTGVLDISNASNTTRVVVGDGTNPISFKVKPDADSLTGVTRVDVLNNATLNIDNRRRPFLNSLAVGSTVEYSLTQTTTADTVRISSSIQYYHLKLTKGIKFLSSGTTTVRGDFTADGVTSMNGASTSVSKINVFGNVNFINGSAFDADPGADAARVSIGFNGSSGTQNLNANGTELKLFRIQRDTTTSPCVINVGANSTMTLGGPTGGGLLLNQSGANTTVLSTGANIINFISGGSMSTSSTGKLTTANGTINILKSVGATDAGLLRFTAGSSLAGLTVNLAAAITKDTLTIADSVTIQNLTLTKGKVVVRSTALLEIPNGGSIAGGGANSFVDGKLKRSSNQSLLYTVGKGAKYAPITLTTTGALNVYTVQYFNNTFSTATIDPATLAAFPNYRISTDEYWTVDQEAGAPGTVDVTLSYDAASHILNPSAVRIAHYDGVDWNDLGITVLEAGSTVSSGKITAKNVTTFSPFTFAATAGGVVPIRLEYINAQKINSGNQLTWKLTCLSTSITMEIQRADDSKNFLAITSIIATQERCGQPFDYKDAQPLKGKNYYRLKMIDADGKISYSPILVVINGAKGFEFVGLYPTVVKNETFLSVSTVKPAVIETRVTDMSGRLIKSFGQTIPSGSSLLKIDCSALAPGIYNLTGIAGKSISATIRFVKY